MRTEVQVHVVLADGRAFSLAATVERIDSDAASAFVLRATLTDVARQRYSTLTLGDRRAAGVLGQRSARMAGARSLLGGRALADALSAGDLPHPDALATAVRVSDDGSAWAFDANTLVVRADGVVDLQLAFPEEGITWQLVITPGRARCDVSGACVADGVRHAVARGTAAMFPPRDPRSAPGDCRVTVHLDDSLEALVWRDARDGVLTPLATWTSHYSFHEYVVAWRLQIPASHVDLELRATPGAQELVTITTSEPRWSGRCDVTGSVDGLPVTGVAYVDQVARDADATVTALFVAVPRETGRVVERQMPLPLAREDLVSILGDGTAHYVRDVDVAEVQRVLIEPIRQIIDRKGKAWRSFTSVLCYHALRGDRRRRDVTEALLGFAEVVHAGSLIVDDVEDASPTRRGGPAAHVTHGVPLAINAGTFCYFAWQVWLARLDVPAATKLQIYEIYFEFMRVGHVGQALDLQGFTRAMADEIVETGDVALFARQMQNVYMLKTGAPASVVARVGALIAGAQTPQLHALADLFEALGVAFQIMDDVQNLKGFEGDPKHCEDLAQAKVTMPVLEAMRVLPIGERRDLWDRIGRCAKEPTLVPAIIETLDQAGAFRACRNQAHVLLEDAWSAAAPRLEHSIAKVMLRSFCRYVVECLD